MRLNEQANRIGVMRLLNYPPNREYFLSPSKLRQRYKGRIHFLASAGDSLVFWEFIEYVAWRVYLAEGQSETTFWRFHGGIGHSPFWTIAGHFNEHVCEVLTEVLDERQPMCLATVHDGGLAGLAETASACCSEAAEPGASAYSESGDYSDSETAGETITGASSEIAATGGVGGGQVSDEDIDKVMQAFRDIDENCDGSVTEKGLVQVLETCCPQLIDPGAVRKAIFHANAGGQRYGEVDYAEFLNWALRPPAPNP